MLVLVWPQSWVPGVLRSEGAHNCALTTTHTASQAGPAPAGQQELSRVTQSQHSGGWRAHSLAVSRCPAETTPTLACSRYSALPGDTVRALRVTQTRPGPGNTRPPPLPLLLLLLTADCSITGPTTPDHPPSSPTPGQAPGQTCWRRTGDLPT